MSSLKYGNCLVLFPGCQNLLFSIDHLYFGNDEQSCKGSQEVVSACLSSDQSLLVSVVVREPLTELFSDQYTARGMTGNSLAGLEMFL